MKMTRLLTTLGLLLLLTGCESDERGPGDNGTGAMATVDGASLVYEISGEGETSLVMIHGWASHRGAWEAQVGPLVEAGYRVVTVDLPGHGEASTERVDWRAAAYATDIAQLVDHLRLQRAVLVGHSMGGWISLMAAAEAAEPVVGIVCVDSLHDVEFEYPEGVLEGLVMQLETDFDNALAGFVDGMFPPETNPRLKETVISHAGVADRDALTALMADFGTLDVATMMREAGVPVRCINAGTTFDFAIPTNVEANRRYADFDAVMIDEVGHYPQIEAPDEFNRLLLEVLSEF